MTVHDPAAGTAGRRETLGCIADAVLARRRDVPVRVGIDGVDGAGKTCFADELAALLRGRGVAVLRASVDDFHHPARVRHRRGRRSPEGFFRDSYDLDALRRLLLDPLGPSGDRRIVRAVHDVHREQPVAPVVEDATAADVVVVDGIFLHRPELRRHWDLSVFLAVDVATSVARLAARDGGDPDPDSPANHRYVAGQRLYLDSCHPADHATVVVDNDVLADARIVRRRA